MSTEPYTPRRGHTHTTGGRTPTRIWPRLRGARPSPSPSTSSTPSCATGASRRGSPSRWTTSSGWPSSSTIWASPSLRVDGPAPIRRTSSSSPGPARSSRSPRPPWWPSARPAVPGCRPEDDAVLANLIDAGAPVACIVAKTWDRHVAEALRTSLDEAVAMVRDSVRYLAAHDLRVFLDAEHFFDGYRNNPRLRALRVGRGGGGGGRSARAVRHQRRVAARRCRPGRGRRARPHQRPARDPLPQRRRVRGGQLAGGRPGRRHAGPGVHQRLRRAGRQHRPLRRHPQPLAEAQHPHHPRRPPRAPHAGVPSHRRAGEHRAQPPAGLRGQLGLRPQGRPARQRGGPQRRPLRARRAELGGERHPGGRLGDGRALDPGHEGGRARARARRRGARSGARRAEAAGARGLPLRGGRRLARAAAAAGHGMDLGLLHRRVLPDHHRPRGEAEGTTSAPSG